MSPIDVSPGKTEERHVEAAKETTLTSAGQRRVNIIWEMTQTTIALSVTLMALYISGRLALLAVVTDLTDRQAAIANMAFMLISNLVSLVIGFYFGRTNHQRVGGVGGSISGETR